MSRLCFWAFAFLPLPVLLCAQATSGSDDAVRVGPGVTAPRVVYKVEPEYSPTARADRVQGTVVLQIVVNEKGRASDITVVSPLGFGLDERALAAVETWEFVPGMKDGKPVKILAIVEVKFRFPGIWFDEKAESQRTSFNIALQTLKKTNIASTQIDRAVKSVLDLSRHSFAPAMYLVGSWKRKGERVPKDPEAGLALIQKAAAKNYGPALYEIAICRITGLDLPKDFEKGLEEMRQASILGSPQAQFHLGNRYEIGDGVPRELDRAGRYYRLCAAQGAALCQYRLGHLLLEEPNRRERDYVQAVAWLQLASEQGLSEARDMAARETSNLTPAQSTWVNSLRAQLIRK